MGLFKEILKRAQSFKNRYSSSKTCNNYTAVLLYSQITLLILMNRILTNVTTTTTVQKQPPEVFYEKGVLKNFTKFTEKHLCQSLFI